MDEAALSRGSARRSRRCGALHVVAWLVIATMTLFASASALAQQGPAPPVDEAGRAESLVRFRDSLLHALEQGDTTGVLARFHPDVRLDFGGGEGRDLLRARLREDAELWSELREVLTHGGRFIDDSTFAAPYWYTIEVDDPFDVWIVVGTDVRVLQEPRRDAPVLTTLSDVVVRMHYLAPGVADGWGGVVLADGRRGYVPDRFLRSPVGYRVIVSRRGGAWVITAFVAGD